MKSKEEVKIRFACIGTVAFVRKPLMKTVIFICMGRHVGIANVETYMGRQGQTGIDRDKQGQTETDRDRQGQAGTIRDHQGQMGTSRDMKGLSLFVSVCPCLVPACPCLSLLCPCLSLLVPALSLALPCIIGK